MKVILQQDVRDHGKKGQLVDVSDGYARNFLIPRKLAVEATKENLAEMRQQDAAKQRRAEQEKAKALENAQKLEAVVVRVTAKSGGGARLFGSVTNAEIASALEAQHGIAVEKNKIVIPDSIKNFGTYEVKVKLGHEVSGVIHLMVTEDS